MAIFTPGLAISQISGSSGGQTFSRNRFGQYIRSRAIPINPNSSYQQAIRNAVSQLAARWSQVLTSTQRDAWNSYASNVSVQNRLGQTVYLTGFQMYQRSNASRVQVGETPIDDGPATLSLPEVDSTIAVTIAATTSVMSITFDDGYDWANDDDGRLLVYMGVPQNSGVNYFGGPWRYAGKIEGDSVSPPSSPDTSITGPFSLQAGQHVWVYARQSNGDGRLTGKILRGPVTLT